MEEDDDGSKLLKALSNCTMEYLPSTVNVNGQVASRSSMRAIKIDGSVNSIEVGSDIILVREFYEDLLKKIRSYRVCVLIGNPGIGKSVLQFYYLAVMLNPKLFGELPKDHKECTNAPKVVIRQVGLFMTVYDIENCTAYKALPADPRILRYFNSKVTLYLLEPGESTGVSPYYVGIKCPIFITVSPDTRRYKEFRKNGGICVYMPIYEFEELLDIGKYLLDQGQIPVDMSSLYSPENIKDRFEEYGGIFRYVLPFTLKALKDVRVQKSDALGACNAARLLNVESIEDGLVSHLLKQMIVPKTGPEAFQNFHTRFVNSNITKVLHGSILAVDLQVRINMLRRNDRSGRVDPACRLIYEGVVAELMSSESGVKWAIRASRPRGADNSPVVWSAYDVSQDGMKRSTIPEFSDMVPKVLYYSDDPNYPAVDFFYKSKVDEKDRLFAFQVTAKSDRGENVEVSAYQKFLVKVGLKDSSQVTLCLIPHPSNALGAYITFTNNSTNADLKKLQQELNTSTYHVIQVPLEYFRELSDDDVKISR